MYPLAIRFHRPLPQRTSSFMSVHVPTRGVYFACPVLSLSCALHSGPSPPLNCQYVFETGNKSNYQNDSIILKKMGTKYQHAMQCNFCFANIKEIYPC